MNNLKDIIKKSDIILFHGSSSSGKTYLINKLIDKYDLIYISSDNIFKKLREKYKFYNNNKIQSLVYDELLKEVNLNLNIKPIIIDDINLNIDIKNINISKVLLFRNFNFIYKYNQLRKLGDRRSHDSILKSFSLLYTFEDKINIHITKISINDIINFLNKDITLTDKIKDNTIKLVLKNMNFNYDKSLIKVKHFIYPKYKYDLIIK